ncbi:hypothetical protein H5410_008323 [Solanum commersonii]|uniref:Uncharacterized protein n=1 Tax=Solanum commersonii TaxID=4109 RepID=A0A9J6AFB8_SOLCO|nr:hypothetical protein H5410_008323 [Solanum commersonii]
MANTTNRYFEVFFFWVQQSVDINGQIEKKRPPQKQKCVTGKERIPIEVHLIYRIPEHEETPKSRKMRDILKPPTELDKRMGVEEKIED